MSTPKILIVRFSAIGDCVMAVPVASRIRRSDPNAHIVWAIERRCADVVDTEKLVDKKVELPWEDWRKRKTSPAAWREQLSIYSRLRREKFDFGLDLQGHAKTAICLRIAAPKKRIAAQATDAFARLLNPILPSPPEGTHTVERNLLTLTTLCNFGGDASPIMPALREERCAVRCVREGKPLSTITVATGHPEKSYFGESWMQVAAGLMRNGSEVAFLGGPTDVAPKADGAKDLVGKLTLRQTMAWVAESDLHLVADTGTGHIAAAYGVPTISVFGPTDPKVFRPYTDRGLVLRKSNKTEDVSPDKILEAAALLLEQKNAALSR